MAKIFGLVGPMSGKMGNSVMSITNGVQIVRQYQPNVSNPNTNKQVEARAKLKLMSQLSAVLGPYIAIRRMGNVSGRNQFTKLNYPLVEYATDQASINLNNVQLTMSAVGLPIVEATRSTEAPSTLNVQMGFPISDVSRIVYVVMTKDNDQKLRVAASTVVSTPGTGNAYATSILTGSPREAVVLAYGIRDNSANARTAFGDLIAPTAEEVAELIVSRSLLENDVTLTETRGVTVPVA